MHILVPTKRTKMVAARHIFLPPKYTKMLLPADGTAVHDRTEKFTTEKSPDLVAVLGDHFLVVSGK